MPVNEHLLNSACSQLDYEQVLEILESGFVKEKFGQPDDFSTNNRQFFHKLFGARRYFIFYRLQELKTKMEKSDLKLGCRCLSYAVGHPTHPNIPINISYTHTQVQIFVNMIIFSRPSTSPVCMVFNRLDSATCNNFMKIWSILDVCKKIKIKNVLEFYLDKP